MSSTKCIRYLILTVAATVLLLLSASTSIVGITAPQTQLPEAHASDDDDDCIDYSRSDKTIKLTCNNTTTFGQLAKNINNDSVIKNLGNGEYLLSANIELMGGNSRLNIASPEVTWIKISNKGSPQYNILVDGGQMDINGVKITSWDPDENSVVYQDASGLIPRPYINYEEVKGGAINNSELAYMGYSGNEKRGFSITKTSADIEIRNSDFHHWWYAFYSNGAKNVTIDSNKFHDNYKYALDPHTGTHDINITNNEVYNNPGSGIICSLDCSDILIENNTVHDNGSNGISFSRNMHDSIVRNNVIYNSPRGIIINESPNNEVYGNIIYNTSNGFHLTAPSSPPLDGHTTKNKIYNNTVRNSENGFVNIRVHRNILANNTLGNIRSFEYSLEGGAEVTIKNQHFTDDKIIGNPGKITIQDSGTIEINGKTFNTDNNDGGASFSKNLKGNTTITVNSK